MFIFDFFVHFIICCKVWGFTTVLLYALSNCQQNVIVWLCLMVLQLCHNTAWRFKKKMGDSDEELDKRNSREKFRPERNDYERRSDDRRGREPWEDRCSNVLKNYVWGSVKACVTCYWCRQIVLKYCIALCTFLHNSYHYVIFKHLQVKSKGYCKNTIWLR